MVKHDWKWLEEEVFMYLGQYSAKKFISTLRRIVNSHRPTRVDKNCKVRSLQVTPWQLLPLIMQLAFFIKFQWTRYARGCFHIQIFLYSWGWGVHSFCREGSCLHKVHIFLISIKFCTGLSMSICPFFRLCVCPTAQYAWQTFFLWLKFAKTFENDPNRPQGTPTTLDSLFTEAKKTFAFCVFS